MNELIHVELINYVQLYIKGFKNGTNNNTYSDIIYLLEKKQVLDYMKCQLKILHADICILITVVYRKLCNAYKKQLYYRNQVKRVSNHLFSGDFIMNGTNIIMDHNVYIDKLFLIYTLYLI